MRDNWREIWNENKVLLASLALVTLFLLAFLWNRIFVLIEAGYAGIIYRPFSGGTDVNRTYNEGLHIVAPWNRVTMYNTRVQQTGDTFEVLSSDGLEIAVDVSIRYRPVREQLGLLHRDIGPEYVTKIIKPEIQSQFRFILGQYLPAEIYTSQGFIVQTVKQGGLAQLDDRYILLDDLLLKAVRLPLPVAQSIESKLRAQQLALEFDYRLQTEVKEAQRKRIEADGIRAFQEIITAGGITESYLRFRGIEATLELAKSPNSKVIVIGGGRDGMPIILDGRTDSTVQDESLETSFRGRGGNPQASGTTR
jgi:regulator of protease activity HflC (stomatin/prohibitin superfamily)